MSLHKKYISIKNKLWTPTTIPQHARLSHSCEEVISYLLQTYSQSVIAGGYAAFVTNLKSFYSDVDIFVQVDSSIEVGTVYNDVKSKITDLAADRKLNIGFSPLTKNLQKSVSSKFCVHLKRNLSR